jgi:hypothetical protein
MCSDEQMVSLVTLGMTKDMSRPDYRYRTSLAYRGSARCLCMHGAKFHSLMLRTVYRPSWAVVLKHVVPTLIKQSGRAGRSTKTCTLCNAQGVLQHLKAQINTAVCFIKLHGCDDAVVVSAPLSTPDVQRTIHEDREEGLVGNRALQLNTAAGMCILLHGHVGNRQQQHYHGSIVVERPRGAHNASTSGAAVSKVSCRQLQQQLASTAAVYWYPAVPAERDAELASKTHAALEPDASNVRTTTS